MQREKIEGSTLLLSCVYSDCLIQTCAGSLNMARFVMRACFSAWLKLVLFAPLQYAVWHGLTWFLMPV